MKKIVSSVLVCILLLSTVFVLASCEKKLYGTYETESGSVAFEFEGDTVTLKMGSTSVEGSYAIEEDKITFDFDSILAALYNGEKDFAEGNEGGKAYIKISGITYFKK